MKPNTELDELLDIVDEHDQVIKTVLRSQARDEKYRRIVLAFLRFQDGSMCFLRRTAHKEVYPSRLAIVGGCVQAGESYEDAFKREVMEEVSIDVNKHEYRLLGIVHPHEIVPHTIFKAIYEITVTETQVQCNPDDFSDYVWVTPDQFLNNTALNDLICPDLPHLVKRFYSHSGK